MNKLKSILLFLMLSIGISTPTRKQFSEAFIQTAKIGNLANSNDSVSRLSEMGLIPGSEIRIIKKNPFGGPVQLRLNNSYIVIRKEDAQLIEITTS